MSVPFHDLVAALARFDVRYVLIGVSGANYYSQSPASTFLTKDRDLYLPADPTNLVRAWEACDSLTLELTCSGEPLDQPRDLWLARRIVERRALTRASDGADLLVDLSFVMGEFQFDEVWQSRRTFLVEGNRLPVARLRDIVKSKAAAGRLKDRLFLETHKEELLGLLGSQLHDEES